jgi:Kdo2-lipid IVA lauroyltransferase/acyltransferase
MRNRDERSAALQERPAPTRWYTHGWNRELSWRLIHSIIPKVPRLLRPPIHAATTAVCYLAMPRERRAVRLNLERVTRRPGLPARLMAFRLFYNFSKFMVGYTDLERIRPETMGRWVDGGDDAWRLMETLLAEGKGLILLTLHLGNWEVGLAHLAGLGRPVNVVLRPEEEARRRAGVRVIPAGESAWNGLELLLCLRRGEIVAIQGDRPFGPLRERAQLFGAPVDLPAGPFLLAQASGAPILAGCVPIRGHFRYRIVQEGPIRVGPGPGGVRTAVKAFARILETFVSAYPTQWFNFYEVWERTEGEDAPPG